MLKNARLSWLRRPSTKLLLLSMGAIGCKSDTKHELTLQVGPDRIIRFAPTAGFAQYFEIPGQDDRLRIVLASYDVGCNSYVPPDQGQVYVSVTVQARPGETLLGKKIPWEGTKQQLTAAETAAKDEEQNQDTSDTVFAYALPFVRLAKDARPLPPGGYITIRKFDREPYGTIEGEFEFSDAGEGEAATAALLGPFRVQLCHVALDEARGGSAPSQSTEKSEKDKTNEKK